MKAPRIQISWIMAFVAFAALNFGAIRLMSDLQSAIYGAKTYAEFQEFVRMHKVADALKFGAIPMVNVLAVGLLIGYAGRGRMNRRFLWGFEVFGTIALALFIAIACLYADSLIMPYLMLVEPLVQRNGPYITTIGKLIGYSACTVMLVLPQVVVAGIGGFLTRNFRISGSVAEPPPSPFKAL
jgi:hypothetical protein